MKNENKSIAKKEQRREKVSTMLNTEESEQLQKLVAKTRLKKSVIIRMLLRRGEILIRFREPWEKELLEKIFRCMDSIREDLHEIEWQMRMSDEPDKTDLSFAPTIVTEMTRIRKMLEK